MNITHNKTHHRLFNIWRTMKARVTNSKNISYKNYGARGVTICERWLDVNNFINDMYPTFSEGLSIDRIDNNGNYEPSNCRWATKITQQRNTRVLRRDNKSGYRGVSFEKRKKKYRARIVINAKGKHIGLFKTAEDAGYAYDKYVIDNNLEHNTNGLYKKELHNER